MIATAGSKFIQLIAVAIIQKQANTILIIHTNLSQGCLKLL